MQKGSYQFEQLESRRQEITCLAAVLASQGILERILSNPDWWDRTKC